MTKALMEQLDDIGITITDEDGVLLKLCFCVVLHCDELGSPEKRGAVLKILDEYAGLYDDRLRWTTNPATARLRKLKAGISSYLHPREWLLNIHPNEGWEILFHGGGELSDATDISFYANAGSRLDTDKHYVSTVVCRFPLVDLFTGRLAVQERLARWCAWLQPLHARAGLGIGESFDHADCAPSRLQQSNLLRRFPGLQTCNMISSYYWDNRGLHDGPAGADWIIALSKPFVDKLGGQEDVKQAMSPLPVLPYGGEPGGLILQAGAWPQPGNAEQGLNLPEYEQMGRVIEPIRAREGGRALWEADPADPYGGNESKEITDQWLQRFSPKSERK